MAGLVLLPLYFNPFAAHPFEPSKSMLLRWLAAGMAASVAAGLVIGPARLSRPARATHMAAAAYLAALALATATSIGPAASLLGVGDGHGLLSIGAAALVGLGATWALSTWQQIGRLVTALIFGSVPVLFYGWVQFFGFDRLHWVTDQASPVHATLGRNIFLGAYLAMVIPFTLARLIAPRREDGESRPAYAILATLQIGCLVVTLARGAWAAFLAGALVLLWLTLRARGGSVRLWLMPAAAAGIAVYVLIAWRGPLLFGDSVRIFRGETFVARREIADQSRLATWGRALSLAAARPLVGYGPETFALAGGEPPDAVTPYASDPHNIFLWHLTAGGVVALGCYLWLLAALGREMWAVYALQPRASPEQAIAAAAPAALAAYLVQAQFNPESLTTLLLFWMLAGLPGAIERAAAGETQRTPRFTTEGTEATERRNTPLTRRPPRT